MTTTTRWAPGARVDRTTAVRLLVEEARPDLAGQIPPERWSHVLRRVEDSMGGLYVSDRPGRIGTGLMWLSALAGGRGPNARRPAPYQLPELRIWSTTAMTTPADAHRPGRWITGVDVNAMFVAAAQVVALGSGRPDLVDRPTDLRRPGFIAVEPRSDWPAPFTDFPAGHWMPTPLAQLLAERLGKPPEASEGLFWAEHRPWLRPFAQRALAARRQLLTDDPVDRAAGAYLKAISNATVDGVLTTASNRAWHRPDWAHLVRAQAAANMWRHLYRADRPPTAQVTDAAFYVVDSIGERPPIPDPPSGPAFSTQPGRFKIHRICPFTDEMRTAVHTGRAMHLQTLVKRAAT